MRRKQLGKKVFLRYPCFKATFFIDLTQGYFTQCCAVNVYQPAL